MVWRGFSSLLFNQIISMEGNNDLRKGMCFTLETVQVTLSQLHSESSYLEPIKRAMEKVTMPDLLGLHLSKSSGVETYWIPLSFQNWSRGANLFETKLS